MLYMVFTLVVVVLVTTFAYVDTTFPATRMLLDFCEDAALPATLIELLFAVVLAALAAEEIFVVLDLIVLLCFVVEEGLVVLDLVEEDFNVVVVVDDVLAEVAVGKVLAEIVAVDDRTELRPAGVETLELVELAADEDDLIEEETGVDVKMLEELVLVDVVDVVEATVELVLVDVVDVDETTVELGSGGGCCPFARFT